MYCVRADSCGTEECDCGGWCAEIKQEPADVCYLFVTMLLFTTETTFALTDQVFEVFLADGTIVRAFVTVCRLSSVCLSVCDVLYCGETVRPSEKVSEGVNRKPGSKSSFFGSPPYFYFRFWLYGHRDGHFLPYVLWRNGTS